MLNKFFKSPFTELRRLFKNEDTRFILSVGLKVTFISVGISVVVHWFIFQILRVNRGFFKANGFPEFKENVFYDIIINESIDTLPILFLSHIFIFFIGCYLGWLILRPFRTISEYCEKVIDHPNTVYQLEQFNTYALLTRFSEFFFEFLRDARKKNEIPVQGIPPQFSRIHKPVFDPIFALHFGLLLIFISISTAVFIIQSSSSIYTEMVELATKTLPNKQEVSLYLSSQVFVLDEIVNLTIALIAIGYVLLGFHLYAKVSGAAFGIFSTMRSFMKGNHSSRVHLVGFAYVRDYTRKINKYLDFMQNNYSKTNPKD